MDELPDLDIRTEPQQPADDEAAPPSKGSPAVWIAAVIAVAVLAGGVYYLLPPKALPPPVRTESRPITPKTVTDRPLGGQAEAIDVPPLDRSDDTVRTLVRALSTAAPVAAWLTTNNLIRNFTAVVANVADGPTPPNRLLGVLKPKASFRTEAHGGRTYIDPQSYARYDAIADAAGAIDPAAAARLYATLKPRIQDAYRDLGPADPDFDHILRRAVVRLLSTPVVDGPVEVVPKGIGWGYADDRLENLTSSQKQLLRMGPRNVRLVQGALRRIAVALGIDAAQLPPS